MLKETATLGLVEDEMTSDCQVVPLPDSKKNLMVVLSTLSAILAVYPWNDSCRLDSSHFTI